VDTDQATGLAEVNTAVSQMDQVTQQNASSSEELSSTAEELATQAEALKELMAFFTVAGFEGDREGGSPTHVGDVPRPGAALRGAAAQQRKAWSGKKQRASSPRAAPDPDDEFSRF